MPSKKKQYPGPTFGLRTMGIPVYEKELERGVNAAVFPLERAVYVSPKSGLTASRAEHELTHLRQLARYGILSLPAAGLQNILTILRRRDVATESPWELEAYERQAKTERREKAETKARTAQYAADKRRAGRARSTSEKVRDK